MYCRYCGRQTKSDATVCDACLKKQNKNGRIKNKRTPIILASVLLLVLIVVAFIIFICQAKNRASNLFANGLDSLIITRETSGTDDIGTKIANELIEGISYEIQSIREDEAVIVVTAPNIRALYKQILKEQGDTVPSTAEEYQNLMDEILSRVDEEMRKGSYDYLITEITVCLNDDGEIEMSYELLDAFYGGLLTLQEELVSEYIGGDGQ